MLAVPPTVASGSLSTEFPPSLKPLVTPLLRASIIPLKTQMHLLTWITVMLTNSSGFSTTQLSISDLQVMPQLKYIIFSM